MPNLFNTFAQSLSPVYDTTEAYAIARLIFEDTFNIYTRHNIVLDKEQLETLESIKERLLQGEPVQYITGIADFYGFKFSVDKSVLIPRCETEELVRLLLEETKKQENTILNILDIGTGSGCIPISIKQKNKQHQIFAIDISEAALNIAQRNAIDNKTNIYFKKIDILEKDSYKNIFFKPNFDIIVSNPPYIPEREKKIMHKNVLNYEPHLALFVDDENPLLFYDKISDFALKTLKKDGLLFFELNEFNAQNVAQMLDNKGFINIEVIKDMSGKDRMLKAKASISRPLF